MLLGSISCDTAPVSALRVDGAFDGVCACFVPGTWTWSMRCKRYGRMTGSGDGCLSTASSRTCCAECATTVQCSRPGILAWAKMTGHAHVFAHLNARVGHELGLREDEQVSSTWLEWTFAHPAHSIPGCVERLLRLRRRRGRWRCSPSRSGRRSRRWGSRGNTNERHVGGKVGLLRLAHDLQAVLVPQVELLCPIALANFVHDLDVTALLHTDAVSSRSDATWSEGSHAPKCS